MVLSFGVGSSPNHGHGYALQSLRFWSNFNDADDVVDSEAVPPLGSRSSVRSWNSRPAGHNRWHRGGAYRGDSEAPAVVRHFREVARRRGVRPLASRYQAVRCSATSSPG